MGSKFVFFFLFSREGVGFQVFFFPFFLFSGPGFFWGGAGWLPKFSKMWNQLASGGSALFATYGVRGLKIGQQNA